MLLARSQYTHHHHHRRHHAHGLPPSLFILWPTLRTLYCWHDLSASHWKCELWNFVWMCVIEIMDLVIQIRYDFHSQNEKNIGLGLRSSMWQNCVVHTSHISPSVVALAEAAQAQAYTKNNNNNKKKLGFRAFCTFSIKSVGKLTKTKIYTYFLTPFYCDDASYASALGIISLPLHWVRVKWDWSHLCMRCRAIIIRWFVCLRIRDQWTSDDVIRVCCGYT